MSFLSRRLNPDQPPGNLGSRESQDELKGAETEDVSLRKPLTPTEPERQQAIEGGPRPSYPRPPTDHLRSSLSPRPPTDMLRPSALRTPTNGLRSSGLPLRSSAEASQQQSSMPSGPSQNGLNRPPSDHLTRTGSSATSGSSRPGTGPLKRNGSDESTLALEIVRQIHERLLQGADRKLDPDPERVRQKIEEALDSVINSNRLTLSRVDRQKYLEFATAEILGYGPIDHLLADDSISEIMVNGPKLIYVERKGKLEKAEVTFQDNKHVVAIIDRILQPIGRRCDESQPYVDARLPDGSRVNIIIPPLALDGPTITIRKFSKKPLTVEDLINFGSMTHELATFLEACIKGKLNIIVSGGTGTGKTTVLNVLSGYIPEDDRIITIEDAAELQLHQEHVVRLETRPANIEGKGRVQIRDLVINALRMRPDRLVIGECRGGEALDMLQAMNTGHDGSLTTLHANSPREAISRLETLVLMAGMDLPLKAIREQIAKAVNLIIQLGRLQDGSRRVVAVTEVQGMEGDVVVMQDVFIFKQEGVDKSTGKIIGKFAPMGIRPKFTERLEAEGILLAPDVFGSITRRF